MSNQATPFVVAEPRPAHEALDIHWLVQACLKGNEDAWFILIAAHRRLILSIPLKYGFSTEDAADVLQEVCVVLVRELSRVREPRALAAWLIRITSQTCARWRSRERQHESVPVEDDGACPLTACDPPVEQMICEVEQTRALHAVLDEAPPRCKRLVEMLFFSEPAVPYDEVAKNLGVATGSVGFLRMRCLACLRKQLVDKGYGEEVMTLFRNAIISPGIQ